MTKRFKKTVKRFILATAVIFTATMATGCESMERMSKSIDSELGGLERKVEVVIDGKVFRTYEGKFDIVADGSKVKFVNDGKVIILYRSQFDMIIVEEK